MRYIASTLCVLALTAGCAKRAEDVAAAYHSPHAFEKWDCAQLYSETEAMQNEVLRVAGEQDGAADRDVVAVGVGLVLFWPALFLLAAGDDEAQLSHLKGKHKALTTAMEMKGCDPVPTSSAVAALTGAPNAAPGPQGGGGSGAQTGAQSGSPAVQPVAAKPAPAAAAPKPVKAAAPKPATQPTGSGS